MHSGLDASTPRRRHAATPCTPPRPWPICRLPLLTTCMASPLVPSHASQLPLSVPTCRRTCQAARVYNMRPSEACEGRTSAVSTRLLTFFVQRATPRHRHQRSCPPNDAPYKPRGASLMLAAGWPVVPKDCILVPFEPGVELLVGPFPVPLVPFVPLVHSHHRDPRSTPVIRTFSYTLVPPSMDQLNRANKRLASSPTRNPGLRYRKTAQSNHPLSGATAAAKAQTLLLSVHRPFSSPTSFNMHSEHTRHGCMTA